MTPSEQWLNEELRNVAVPDDLAARLREIGTCSDADLDAALKHPAPTTELRERLLAIGTWNNADLDDELRLVAVPTPLLRRCLVIPWEKPARRFTPMRIAVAATMLIAAGGAVWQMWHPDRQNGAPQNQIAVEQPQPNNNGGAPGGLDQNRLPGLPGKNVPRKNGPLPETIVNIPAADPGRNATLPNPALANNIAESGVREPAQSPNKQLPNDKTPAGNAPAPSPEVFGTNIGSDAAAQLISVREPRARGIAPPRVREYDLLFQLRHGVHPFVSPAANPLLAASQVPLNASSESFERVALSLKNRKLPPPASIRVEDFLAAMNYEFSPPREQTLALRTAAGFAPWLPANVGLLQVAVQAGEVRRDPLQPAHLVFVLDATAGIQRDQLWPQLITGLAATAADLLPADRVTLILAGESAQTEGKAQSLGTALTPQEFRAAVTQLQTHVPRGRGDFPAAIQKAAAAVRGSVEKLNNLPARMVLFTAGIGALDAEVLARTEADIQPLLQTGATWDVVDLRDAETLDPRLSQLAAWSRHGVKHAVTARQVRLACGAALTGQSQIVAQYTSLKVTFKPDAVILYRLLGHEATAVTSLIPLQLDGDLLSGDTATALYQVVLKPDGPDIIAIAELQWRDAAGQLQRREQPISRLQFAPSFAAAPWSLQLAALSAETAEILRGSYFTPAANHDLDQLREAAARLPSAARRKPSLQTLEQVWRSAQSAGVGN